MQNYVAGLLFRDNKSQVALVEKTRPEWQKGKFNAIGGKVEPDETADEAMAREFLEETGAHVTDWRFAGVLSGAEFIVQFYVSFSGDLYDLKTIEEEKIGWYAVDKVFDMPIIHNLRWLIPMALDTNNLVAYVTENVA